MTTKPRTPPPPEAGAPLGAPTASQQVEGLRRQGLLRRLASRTRASAELVFPAVPSLVNHYVDVLAEHFASIGRPFAVDELAKLHGILLQKLKEGFDVSPYSNVFVRYNTVNDGGLRIDYAIAMAPSTLAEEYAHWVETRKPPLFGTEPDARILSVVAELGLAAGDVCLDIGAGTGRNSLPLARLGHSVIALEPAPVLASQLEAAAAEERLPVRVVTADVLSGDCPVAPGTCQIAFASQVTSHFRGTDDLRKLFRAMAAALAPGGHALLTLFVTVAGYSPDRIARELGQVFWSTFFTPGEVERALSDLPFSRLSDEDALSYERAHQPAESWPPTSWFEGWAAGEDVFGGLPKPAISLRWLLLRRAHGRLPAA